MSAISRFEYDLTNKQKEQYKEILGDRLIIQCDRNVFSKTLKRIGLFFKQKRFEKVLKNDKG